MEITPHPQQSHSAFPLYAENYPEWGVTKREHYASLLLPALVAKIDPGFYYMECAVKEAIHGADLLIKELSKPTE